MAILKGRGRAARPSGLHDTLPIRTDPRAARPYLGFASDGVAAASGREPTPVSRVGARPCPRLESRNPKEKSSRARVRYSRGWLIGILIVLVVLVAARLALPYVLRSAINRRLNNIPDYGGHVDSVSVSLYRGAYHLTGMEIVKRNGQVREPFFSAKDIDFSLAWRELLHRRVVSDIYLDQPKLNFIKGPTAETSQLTADRRWQDVITDIFPIDINYLKITDGTLRYVNHASNPQVDIRVEHTLAVATGLRNRAGANQDELPANISLRGVTIGNGKLHIDSQAEPLAAQPHFLLKLELEDVSLPALNEFLRAYGNIDVSAGVFKGYLEMTAHDGELFGVFQAALPARRLQRGPGPEPAAGSGDLGNTGPRVCRDFPESSQGAGGDPHSLLGEIRQHGHWRLADLREPGAQRFHPGPARKTR